MFSHNLFEITQSNNNIGTSTFLIEKNLKPLKFPMLQEQKTFNFTRFRNNENLTTLNIFLN